MQGARLLTIALALMIAACSGDDDDRDETAAAGPDLTVASLNILNGLRGPPETIQCRGAGSSPAVGEVPCEAAIDSAEDDDGDGFATRILAGDPNPFAGACGPLPDAICWPSDH